MKENTTALVSIIIPVFNRAGLVLETLASIQRQSYSNWECIIVDDHSSDNTAEVVMAFVSGDDRFRFVKRPGIMRKGANSCRNYGFQISQGSFIQWFDSDDLMGPTMIEEQLSMLDEEADFVVCRAAFFSGDPDNVEYDKRATIQPRTSNPPFEYFSKGFWFGSPQAFFTRRFLEQQGFLFNLELHRHQETEFFVKHLLASPSIRYNENTCLYIRKHEQSITGRYFSIDENERFALDWPAYRSLYLCFSNTCYLTTEALDYFKDLFFRFLRRMRCSRVELIRLYIFCIQRRLFDSGTLATKYLVRRLFLG